MTNEQKKKLADGRAKAKLAKEGSLTPTGIDLSKDLNDFKDETRKSINTILSAVESLINKDEPKDPLPPVEEKLEEEIVSLTSKQREIFEFYFDPTDGFNAWYDVNKNIFTIEVPMSLSNTTPAHRALYKQDLRSKKVDQNNILGSIKEWCILVAQNLHYDRRIRIK